MFHCVCVDVCVLISWFSRSCCCSYHYHLHHHHHRMLLTVLRALSPFLSLSSSQSLICSRYHPPRLGVCVWFIRCHHHLLFFISNHRKSWILLRSNKYANKSSVMSSCSMVGGWCPPMRCMLLSLLCEDRIAWSGGSDDRIHNLEIVVLVLLVVVFVFRYTNY